MGSYGEGPERFSSETWVQRDICDREPWPFEDDFFDFALCVTTLEDVRDPVWVCSELSRVAKAGYVEVPTPIAELMYGVDGRFLGHSHHRWLIFPRDGGLEFMHKPHSIHDDWRLWVVPRWGAKLTLRDQLEPVFWEGSLPAREKLVFPPYDHDELAALVRERFRPSRTELALKRARAGWREARGRAMRGPRALLDRGLERLRRR
jgi:hypothetical protein